MKRLFLACALILPLLFVGCSNDDEPSGGSKIKGSITVGGNTIDLKYGYYSQDDEYAVYLFYDIDLLQYIDKNNGYYTEEDVEFSRLALIYDKEEGKISEIEIHYKYCIKDGKESGTYYESPGDDAYKYLSFSFKNGNIKSSSESIRVDAYTLSDKFLGSFDATFSVEGKLTEVSYIE